MWSSKVFIIFCFICLAHETIGVFTRDYKIIPTSNYKLCDSKTLKLTTLGSGYIITEGRYINNHNTLWENNDVCSFRVRSANSKWGIIAVLQRMELRKSLDTCIDYIEFKRDGVGFFAGSLLRPRLDSSFSRDRYCGVIDRYSPNFDYNDLVTFYDPKGEINVEIFLSSIPLEADERVEYEIVFTPFTECFTESSNSQLKPCDKFGKVCINESFFGDTILNCPFSGCVDEKGCKLELKSEHSNLSTGSRVMIGSFSIIFIVFALFILSLWVFRKHKLLCWADDFAHPREHSGSREGGENQRVELTNTTGVRLAQNQPSVPTTHQAPRIDHDKDLPPSYESLFPDSVPPPSIQDLQPSAPPR